MASLSPQNAHSTETNTSGCLGVAMTYLTYPLVELLDCQLGQRLVGDVVASLSGD